MTWKEDVTLGCISIFFQSSSWPGFHFHIIGRSETTLEAAGKKLREIYKCLMLLRPSALETLKSIYRIKKGRKQSQTDGTSRIKGKCKLTWSGQCWKMSTSI